MKKYNLRRGSITLFFAIGLLFTSAVSIVSTRAATFTTPAAPNTTAIPFHVTLSVSNFSNQSLAASADDVSDPAHAMFSLQNGTSLWYGITAQSNPTGMTPTVANPTGDVVTTTFFGSVPLLPPVGVLPFEQASKGMHYETLRLMAAFSAPNQQLQLTLSPFEPHAITLDIYTFLLQLLGEQAPTPQIGLLAPGMLQELFNASSTMKDFGNVTNDYVQMLQAAPDTSVMLSHAYAFSQALVAMLTDEGEQHVLSDLLWKILGKTIPYAAILKTLISFGTVEFGLGIEGFIRDEALVLAPTLLQQNTPTVLLQSAANTAQPTSTTTANATNTVPVTATPAVAVTPTHTAKSTPTVTR